MNTPGYKQHISSQFNAELEDIRQSFVKSIVFGATISWIAVYQGYHAIPTSEGVSRATTSTVVVSSPPLPGVPTSLV